MADERHRHFLGIEYERGTRKGEFSSIVAGSFLEGNDNTRAMVTALLLDSIVLIVVHIVFLLNL